MGWFIAIIAALILYGALFRGKGGSAGRRETFRDETLERVRAVKVVFRDWDRNMEISESTFEVTPDRREGHYEFMVDSCVMAMPRFEKMSVTLLDGSGQPVDTSAYATAIEEFESDFAVVKVSRKA